MAARYRQGRLGAPASADPLAEACASAVAKWDAAFLAFEPHAAIGAILDLLARANARVEESAPWKLAKDPSRADELDAVLYSLAETLRILSILIEPVLPSAAAGMRSQLARDGSVTIADTAWGGLPPGHVLGAPTPLFPRIETP
jgi:methionyl-tRNA synthetase